MTSVYIGQKATLISRHLLFIEKPLINLLSLKPSANLETNQTKPMKQQQGG